MGMKQLPDGSFTFELDNGFSLGGFQNNAGQFNNSLSRGAGTEYLNSNPSYGNSTLAGLHSFEGVDPTSAYSAGVGNNLSLAEGGLGGAGTILGGTEGKFWGGKTGMDNVTAGLGLANSLVNFAGMFGSHDATMDYLKSGTGVNRAKADSLRQDVQHNADKHTASLANAQRYQQPQV